MLLYGGIMKKAIFLLILLASNLSAFSQSSFLELCKNGTPEQVEAALKAGASVAERGEYAYTPLMMAARDNPDPKVITVLLKAGAKLTDRSETHKTPFMYACQGNPNPEVIRLMLVLGA